MSCKELPIFTVPNLGESKVDSICSRLVGDLKIASQEGFLVG